MAGVVMAPLTEKELEMIQAWYLAHQLAEENSAADDTLAAKLKGYARTVACRPGSACSSGQCFVRPDTNDLRTKAWGGA